MSKPVLVAAWIVAVVATTAIAYVAVTAAGAEVTDRPLTSVVASGAPSTTGDSTSTSAGAAIPTSTSSTTEFGTTGATASSGSATTTAPNSSTSITPITAPEDPWQQTTIPSSGGLVIVSHRPGEVRMQSVAPTPGFTYEIDDAGPSEVRVKFESGDAKVEIRVRWDGGLVTEVDESA